mmetsp:Transcript_21088/g.45877  ORF Transcript_21088/g.45877 Transcript_21088/m.45877 type:complete len:204 (-) Transcript_21088:217-828(-)
MSNVAALLWTAARAIDCLNGSELWLKPGASTTRSSVSEGTITSTDSTSAQRLCLPPLNARHFISQRLLSTLLQSMVCSSRRSASSSSCWSRDPCLMTKMRSCPSRRSSQLRGSSNLPPVAWYSLSTGSGSIAYAPTSSPKIAHARHKRKLQSAGTGEVGSLPSGRATVSFAKAKTSMSSCFAQYFIASFREPWSASRLRWKVV